jgi:ubiquinone/menaquinone biosynthesis C-methylase UbiE
MENWRDIWEAKGNLETADLKTLDGFESTAVMPQAVMHEISRAMDIGASDSVLEVGCGAGMLAEHATCRYVGIDYSRSMVKKHIALLGNSVLLGEASDLPFKDNCFDKVFAFSIFQYFPSRAYAQTAIAEMLRVARTAVFVGDLPMRSHRDSHLLFDPALFADWVISEGFYTPDRFNALRRL